MKDWKFLPHQFLRPWNKVYDELCAPATLVMGDSLFVIGSTYEKNFTLWYSTNPTKNEWKIAVDSFKVGAWDPGLFLDDDNRLYIYHGSSNFYPIYGKLSRIIKIFLINKIDCQNKFKIYYLF